MTREAITPLQKPFCEENGYIVLPGRVPAALLQSLQDDIALSQRCASGRVASVPEIDLGHMQRPDNPRIRPIKLPPACNGAMMHDLTYSDPMLAVYAFPATRAMISCGGIADDTGRPPCGRASLANRLGARFAAPLPSEEFTIYDVQKQLKNRSFGVAQ